MILEETKQVAVGLETWTTRGARFFEDISAFFSMCKRVGWFGGSDLRAVRVEQRHAMPIGSAAECRSEISSNANWKQMCSVGSCVIRGNNSG